MSDADLARAVSTRIAQALSGRGNVTIGEIDRMIINLIEAERDACAKIADAKGTSRSGQILLVGPSVFDAADQVAASIAAAIRDRGNKDTP